MAIKNKALLQIAIDGMPSELTTGQFYDPETDLYCTLGWMAHVAGISHKEMLDGSSLYDRLRSEYGMELEYGVIDPCDLITDFNDSESNNPEDIKNFLREKFLD